MLGAYTPAFYIAGTACIVAALSIWFIDANKRALAPAAREICVRPKVAAKSPRHG